MSLNTEASIEFVFLILYAILFAILFYGYLTRRLKFRSRYTIILFHVAIRLATKATGFTIGVIGYVDVSLLASYFILGGKSPGLSPHVKVDQRRFTPTAEGYFTLVLCTYRCLIWWQNNNFASQDSWLEPRFPPGTPLFKRFLSSFTIIGSRVRPMSIVNVLLTGADAIVISGLSAKDGVHLILETVIYCSYITGGSLMSGNGTKDFNKNLKTAAAMRAAGQIIFLMINTFLAYCIVNTISQSRRENARKGTHPTLLILSVICPLLFIRGLYGVMSGILPTFNFGEGGLAYSFITSEYFVGNVIEWSSCFLLMLTYFASQNQPKKVDVEMYYGAMQRPI